MAKWWRERCIQPNALVPEYRYYVKVCAFTFTFTRLDEMPQYIEYYSQKIHPSTRLPAMNVHERYEYQRWFERLPRYLREESKRVTVVKALAEAFEAFSRMTDVDILPLSHRELRAKETAAKQKRREYERRISYWQEKDTTTGGKGMYHVVVGAGHCLSRYLTFSSIDEMRTLHQRLKDGYYFTGPITKQTVKRVIDVPMTDERRRVIRALERAIRYFEAEQVASEKGDTGNG